MSRNGDGPLSAAAKVQLALRIWWWYVRVRTGMRRAPLPAVVASLASQTPSRRTHSPARLSRAVHRSLRVGDRQPTCLVSSLVLFRLLRSQGEPAELVIGLRENATDQTAHAWVELRGVDVGPPPGRGKHVEMARFG